jgi:membrane protease YdiL (CAAX protease family)
MSKETRNLVIFFVATFIWTWAFYAPLAISGNSPYQMPWMILLIFGGAGPSIIGVAMVLLTYDKEQRRDYWRRCFSLRRIRLLWWLVIFLIFPATLAASIAVDMAMGGSTPGMEQLRGLIANPMMWPLAVFLSFLSGPWSEEFGWRGYALEPIINRFGTLPGTVVLGVIWAVWHLPLYFMPATWHGQMGFRLAGFWTFIASTVALSLIMTWVYLNTNRSILSGMLLHFTSNFTAQLVAPSSDRSEILHAILLLVIGVTGWMLINRRDQAQALRAIEKPRPV